MNVGTNTRTEIWCHSVIHVFDMRLCMAPTLLILTNISLLVRAANFGSEMMMKKKALKVFGVLSWTTM